jgi:superfamily II DNA or RNA helicase
MLERLDSEDISISLLISPELQADDIAAIQSSTDPIKRVQILEQASDRVIDSFINDSSNKKARLELFAWLIVSGKLHIKFAHPVHQSDSDLFHQKTGIFYFPWGDKVAFEGSANESYSGHSRNWEKIQVFRSWVSDDIERLENTRAEFEEYWRGDEGALIVSPISEETIKKLRVISPGKSPIKNGGGDDSAPAVNLWAHQDDALKTFLEKKSGILEMATGTGKTKTALKIFKTLLESGEVEQGIITTDGNDLLNQWYGEVLDNPIYKTGLIRKVFRQFYKYSEGQTYLLQQRGSVLVVSRENLAAVIARITPADALKTMIIHDEIHGMGSPSMVKNLSGTHKNFKYKLGLSATPEREYDAAGSAFIESEVGPTIFTFGIEDAIKKGILVEFDYLPLPYDLSDSDRNRLKAVKAREAIRKKEGRPMSKEEIWRDLAYVYKTAENKPLTFKHYLYDHPEAIKNSIIFVADREYGSRILEVISQISHNYRTYYAEDDQDNLIQFSDGKIDTLITCHKISQGIDIQKLKTVILVSSDRARLETIQRIGRCLRRDPTDPTKRALVIDFCMDNSSEKSADAGRSEWLTGLSNIKREL